MWRSRPTRRASLNSQPASPTNRVLELDGANSFVELPLGAFTNLDEVTVEGWVKWESFGNSSRVLALAAVDTLVAALKPFRNWYLDLGNERDVGDARHVSLAELKELRARVRVLNPQRLVTASFGGHDLSLPDVRGALEEAGVDFLCPHRPRHRASPGETEAETRRTMRLMQQVGRSVPVQYQEPIRRGYTAWEPVATDFLTDLRGALRGGAAGWCFHNGGQRTTPDEQPRRSFDLRAQRLMEQLDAEEMKVVRSVNSVLLDH